MAVITISNAGGNFSSTAAWVGGVVPLAVDSLLASATSGPLTLDGERICAGIDFELYTSTLTMNAGITVNGTQLRLGASMTISAPLGQVGVLRCRTATTLTSNGCVVPFFAFNFNTNQITRTLTDNWTITNYLGFMGNGNAITNGFAFNITNMKLVTNEGGSMGRMNGTTEYRFNGANCTYDASLIDPLTQFHPLGNPIYIDTPGTFTITKYLFLNPFSTTGGFYWVQGTLAGDKIIMMGVTSTSFGVSSTYNLDVNGAGTWTEIGIGDSFNSTTVTTTFNLISDFNFQNMYIMPLTGNQQFTGSQPQVRAPIIFTGATGALKGGDIYISSMPVYQIPAPRLKSTQREVRFNSGVSHTASYLGLMGGGGGTGFGKVHIRSVTPGTKATLNLTGDQGVFYTNFTDIDASGGNTIYTFGGTASNSDNVETITSYVPTSATSFVN